MGQTNAGSMPSGVPPEPRVMALDGFRGLMTVFVLISHFFAEVPGGFTALAVGWIAVDAFFVLSGFLVGRLILDKGSAANFLPVFYIRRLCRTFPIYFVSVAIAIGVFALLPPAVSDFDHLLPLWSYATFTQNFEMAAVGHVGPHWLAPTWTLAVEEQFYLVTPVLMLAVPRRWLLPVLGAIIAGSIAFKAVAIGLPLRPLDPHLMLPARADLLAIGLAAAVIWVDVKPDWERWRSVVRALPIATLVAASLMSPTALGGEVVFVLFGHAVVGVGVAAMLFGLMIRVPEAGRYEARWLVVCGNTSYATYLLHLPILWAVHIVLLGDRPSNETVAGLALSAACLPIVAVTAIVMTKLVEEPVSRYGRSFRWAPPRAAAAEPRALDPGTARST